MNHALLPTIGNAQLPENWLRAKAALSACLRSRPAEFSEKYRAAMAALTACAAEDECASWPDKMAACASYARQSGDETLERLARRINARREKMEGRERPSLTPPHQP